MDCSPPDSSVQGIFQAIILEWVYMHYSRGSPQSRNFLGLIKYIKLYFQEGFTGDSVVESTCQCRRCGFGPWVGKIPWRRTWQPTPVFLLGKSHGRRSLVGYGPRGHKELDTTEQLHFTSYIKETHTQRNYLESKIRSEEPHV